MVPRFKPWLDHRELFALFRTNHGAVKRFESEFAKKFQAKEAVAFPYGRSALWAFLQAVGVNDKEVIMPAYTCSVVAHAISLSGNRPCFVDIRPDDYNMDLDLLEGAITPNTGAIVATHLFGYPLDLDRLEKMVSEAETRYGHKIWLIQDCAHSFGASWNGRLVGTSGDTALYALNISKMMTSIFGGMLTFNDRVLADKIRVWRDLHFRGSSWLKPLKRRLYLLATYIAFNESVYSLTWWLQERTPLLNRLTKAYHLDEITQFPHDFLDQMLDVEAAVGLEQLNKYTEQITRRIENVDFYTDNLKHKITYKLPPQIEGATYSHYVLQVSSRAEILSSFARSGVELGQLIQYTVPQLTPYRQSSVNFPVAEKASVMTVNLPIWPALKTSQREKIVRLIIEYDER